MWFLIHLQYQFETTYENKICFKLMQICFFFNISWSFWRQDIQIDGLIHWINSMKTLIIIEAFCNICISVELIFILSLLPDVKIVNNFIKYWMWPSLDDIFTTFPHSWYTEVIIKSYQTFRQRYVLFASWNFRFQNHNSHRWSNHDNLTFIV